MKNPLLVFLFLTPAITLAQQISMIDIDSWTDNNWENNFLHSYSYNNNDQIESILQQSWDGSIYINSGLTNYSNYMGDIVGQTITQSWNNNTWINSTRIVNETVNNLLFESEFSSWFNNTWNNFSLNGYSYDENDYLDYFIQQTWENGAYRNNSQAFYTNNNNGLPTQLIGDSWNTSSNSWQPSYRTTNTYNNDNKITSFLNEIWNGNGYTNNTRNTYNYDIDGFLVEIVTEFWDLNINDWENSSLITYQNNNDGSISILTTQIWDQTIGTWENSTRWTYSYNTLGVSKHKKNSFSTYPNPASEDITIISSNNKFHYQLYEINGKLITTGSSNNSNYSIDVQHLASGMYILQIISTQGIVSQKVIKQ